MTDGEQIEKLRKALIGLVGSEDMKELEAMELAIRSMPVCDEDRMNTLNAIHAIRDTVKEKTE